MFPEYYGQRTIVRLIGAAPVIIGAVTPVRERTVSELLDDLRGVRDELAGIGAAGAERGDTRERLLAAAATRFSRYGFYGTSIRHLTSDVSITAAGFYSHFSSKEELVSVAVARGYASFLDAVVLGAPDELAFDEPTSRDRFLALCARHARFTAEQADPSRLGNDLLRAGLDDLVQPDVGELLRRAQADFFALVVAVLAAAREEAQVSDGIDVGLLAEGALALNEVQITSPRRDNAFAVTSIEERTALVARLVGLSSPSR